MTTADLPLPRPSPVGVVRTALARLEAARPAPVLAVLVAAQWLAVLALALVVRHNGWLYFQGGDQLWHYTAGWLLAHGQLPQTPVAYGWSTTLLPIAAAAGPDLTDALPAIVLLDTLVFLPIALLSIYGIGARIGGRVFGYWTAAAWIAVPFLGILYVVEGYHQKYTELTLPQSLGLSAMSDFPSIALLLAAAYLLVRTLDRPSLLDAAAAGVALGASIAVKPSNALFVLPAALALLARRRVRELVVAAIAVVPFALVLALWKQRGLGDLPVFALSPPAAREALGPAGVFAPVHRYLDFDWHHLNENLLAIREHFWSLRLLEAFVVIGTIALARRSKALALLVGGWFLVFLIAKGTYGYSSVDDASFLRLLLPAAPAFVLLAASFPLLVPRFGERLVQLGRASAPPPPGRRVAAGALLGLAVFALYPAIAIGAATKLRGPDPRAITIGATTLVGVDPSLAASAAVHGREVDLKWHARDAGPTRRLYRIVRTRGTNDLTCERQHDEPDDCALGGTVLATVRGSEFVDRPPPGLWTYRVGAAANWLDQPDQGDIFAVSRPLAVRVP